MKKVIFLFFVPLFCFAAESVDINSASLSQLDTLAGIGPAIGQRIIDARPFGSVDDLIKVSGIGEKTLQKIKAQGLACVNCQTKNASYPAENDVLSLTDNVPEKTIEGVYINEIMPSPKGADEEEEWIEIFNSNSFEADLSGWIISDLEGSKSTFTLNVKLPGTSFLVFKRPETKILLNNDKDTVILSYPTWKTADSVTFEKAPTGYSYIRTDSGWKWTSNPTPGAMNKTSVAQAKTILPKTEKYDSNEEVKAELASLATPINQEKMERNPWFLFFIVLGTTIVSAAIVLFIRQKFLNKNSN